MGDMGDGDDWRDEPISMAELAQQNREWKPRNDEPAPRLDQIERDRPSSFSMAGRTEQSKAGWFVFLLLVFLAVGAVVFTAGFLWFSLVEPAQPPQPPPGMTGFGDL